MGCRSLRTVKVLKVLTLKGGNQWKVLTLRSGRVLGKNYLLNEVIAQEVLLGTFNGYDLKL